ncbi:MAG: prolyl oligopeptidase family serine peptidase [Trueperaceae bacterium]
MHARSALVVLRVVGAVLVLSVAIAQSEDRRRFTVDDLLSLQALNKVVPSPAGDLIAVVIQRPAQGNGPANENMFSNDRADIWLISAESGEIENLTDGTGRDSYFSPLWSPDGQRLAMLSTEGNDGIRLYVWDRSGDSLKRLTEQSVDVEANFGGRSLFDRVSAVWLNDRELLTVLLPVGELPVDYFTSNPQGVIVPKWEATQAGLEPSVSVLHSNVGSPEDWTLERTMVRIDVESGDITELTKGEIRVVSLSPDGRRAAIITVSGPDELPVEGGLPFPPGWNVYTWRPYVHTKLAVLELEGAGELTWFPEVVDPSIFTYRSDLQWSPSADSLAVLVERDESAAGRALFRIDVNAAEADPIGVGAANISSFAWYGDELLLNVDGDWQVAARSAEAAGGDYEDLPQQLRGFGAGGLAGVSDDDFFLLGASGRLTNATEDFAPAIQRIIWPSATSTDSSGEWILGTSDGMYHALAEGDALRLSPVKSPDAAASFLAYAPPSQTAVFNKSDPDGDYLWSGNPHTGDYINTLSLNTHLARVEDAERILISYENDDGQPLKGLVVLPKDYQEGRAYPLIVTLYTGSVVRDEAYRPASKNQSRLYHPLLFTARDYAVLYPSIPLPSTSGPIDPLSELSKNVLPAVDEVVRLGVADSERIGLLGHSYGGYAVVGLLGQTERFKAAIASAPFVDLAAYNDMIPFKLRYFDLAAELSLVYSAEFENPNAVLRMGIRPQQDPEQYSRNSPLVYADRIESPLMLIQGDLDPVPMAQSEALFKRLRRQGNEAMLVRYWGEGHVIMSPANIRDVLERIFGWFDTYLGDE